MTTVTKLNRENDMNAEEAREITNTAKNTPIDERILRVIDGRIKSAARNGDHYINDPHIARPENGSEFALTGKLKEAVFYHYRSQGFKVIDKETLYPGHPTGRPYIKLSWEV